MVWEYAVSKVIVWRTYKKKNSGSHTLSSHLLTCLHLALVLLGPHVTSLALSRLITGKSRMMTKQNAL